MIVRLGKAVVNRIIQWATATPVSRFIHRGQNVIISAYMQCNYPERVRLGNHIYIGPWALLHSQGGLIIKDGVIIGPRVSVYTYNHNYMNGAAVPYDGMILKKPVVINEGVWIGGNVVIVPGVVVGKGAVIGAGSVVTRDIPEMAVVGGNPAKVIKYRDKSEFEKLWNSGQLYNKLKREGRIQFQEIEFS